MIFTVPMAGSHAVAPEALMQLFEGSENREGGKEELAIRTTNDLNRSECSCVGFHNPDTSVDVCEWRYILSIWQLPTVPFQGQGGKLTPFTLLQNAVLHVISQQQRLLN